MTYEEGFQNGLRAAAKRYDLIIYLLQQGNNTEQAIKEALKIEDYLLGTSDSKLITAARDFVNSVKGA